MLYPFRICASFPVGNFNGMGPVKYIDFSPANTFLAPCGCAYPEPVLTLSLLLETSTLGHCLKLKINLLVPPWSFDAGHYQNFKGDHPRSLNSSPARKVKTVFPVPPCSFNNGHPQNYKDRPRSLSAILPRNVKTAFQRLSRP